jgi:hypothetical protein
MFRGKGAEKFCVFKIFLAENFVLEMIGLRCGRRI